MIYSPAIITSILSSSKARLANHEFFVPLPFSSWTTIKLGVLLRPAQQGDADRAIAGMICHPRMALGVVAGNQNGLGGPAACHFVGFGTFGAYANPSNSFSQVQVPPEDYMSISAGADFTFAKREGTTETRTAADIGWSFQTTTNTAATNPVGDMFMVTITKGSPWSFRTFSRTSTASPSLSAMTVADFRRLMESGIAGEVRTSYTVSAAANNTLAVDEGTYGTLDHFYFRWCSDSPPMYLDAYAIRKIGV